MSLTQIDMALSSDLGGFAWMGEMDVTVDLTGLATLLREDGIWRVFVSQRQMALGSFAGLAYMVHNMCAVTCWAPTMY